jgi:hypothetical protein
VVSRYAEPNAAISSNVATMRSRCCRSVSGRGGRPGRTAALCSCPLVSVTESRAGASLLDRLPCGSFAIAAARPPPPQSNYRLRGC